MIYPESLDDYYQKIQQPRHQNLFLCFYNSTQDLQIRQDFLKIVGKKTTYIVVKQQTYV